MDQKDNRITEKYCYPNGGKYSKTDGILNGEPQFDKIQKVKD